jgi:hypothetical protein
MGYSLDLGDAFGKRWDRHGQRHGLVRDNWGVERDFRQSNSSGCCFRPMRSMCRSTRSNYVLGVHSDFLAKHILRVYFFIEPCGVDYTTALVPVSCTRSGLIRSESANASCTHKNKRTKGSFVRFDESSLLHCTALSPTFKVRALWRCCDMQSYMGFILTDF